MPCLESVGGEIMQGRARGCESVAGRSLSHRRKYDRLHHHQRQPLSNPCAMTTRLQSGISTSASAGLTASSSWECSSTGRSSSTVFPAILRLASSHPICCHFVCRRQGYCRQTTSLRPRLRGSQLVWRLRRDRHLQHAAFRSRPPDAGKPSVEEVQHHTVSASGSHSRIGSTRPHNGTGRHGKIL